MVKKSKLLTALDAHKGRDYEAEKRQKQVKAAEKRKREKTAKKDQAEDSDEEDEINGMNGAEIDIDDDFAAFSDDDKENSTALTPNGTSTIPQPTDSHDQSASEADPDSDVALSDLSDADLEDTIPHQRLTINNGPALLASRKRIALLKDYSPSTVPFHIHNSLISSLPPTTTSIPDANDDLTRELEFYRVARDAAIASRALLTKEKIPFSRPADYFAEMVKSDTHMGLVRKKMYDSAAGKKAAEEARRLRDAKKFGKAVQVAKEQERAKEKRDTLDKIKDLKRKRKGTDTGLVRESDRPSSTKNQSNLANGNGNGNGNDDDDIFQRIDVESAPSKDRSGRERGGATRGNNKRQKKDSKFGFGGKKRFGKSGDAESSADMRGFSVGRMKGRGGGTSRGGGGRGGRGGGGGGGGGGTKRLGKSRRNASS